MILVTGGSGFIGKHLVKYLLEKDHVVTIFDDFSNSTKESITFLLDAGAKLIEGDITDSTSITNAIKGQDAVVHLAAKISVEDSIRNPASTFRVNVDGTKNVLNACKENHVKKLVVASSAAVYGENLSSQGLSEDSKINPISPYGESKALMESEIKKFVAKDDVNCVVLRFFNIYGVGQSFEYAGVITRFIEKIRANMPLEIFGDGKQTRDFVAVQDIVEAIYLSIMSTRSGTFNIASGKSVTIKELADLLISLSGKNIGIEYRPAKEGDIRNSKADISLAQTELRFTPKFELNEIRNLL